MFSTNLSYKDKLDALQNEFKISVSREMSEEVQNMCNLSMGVYSKGYDSGYGSGYDSGYGSGYDSGYGSGYDSGISAGEMKKAKETAYKLQDKGMSCEEIADAVEIDTDTVRAWLAEREALLVK